MYMMMYFLLLLPLVSLGMIEMEVVPAAAEEEESLSCASPVSVEDACRGASETHYAVAYDHCVSSLGADPRSKDAGLGMHGLAVLATRMAADHAAATESRIGDLSELELEAADASPHARARYGHCLEQYGAAADLLRDAVDNLRARIYGKAMEQIAAAMGASESCEDAWKGMEEVSIPVAQHDREYGRMAHIALGFTHAAA
ncbi:unnamed protein product [Urochloa humidicola]